MALRKVAGHYAAGLQDGEDLFPSPVEVSGHIGDGFAAKHIIQIHSKQSDHTIQLKTPTMDIVAEKAQGEEMFHSRLRFNEQLVEGVLFSRTIYVEKGTAYNLHHHDGGRVDLFCEIFEEGPPY